MSNVGLMEYLPPVQQPQAIVHGANKYYGDIASGYDAKRDTSPKWTIEQAIIERMISELPEGSMVLDCPVGTGRFLNCYVANKLKFIGMDRSGDMLVQSALKLLPEDRVAAWVQASNERNTVLPFRLADHGDSMLVIGDACKTGLKDKSVDCAVICRLTRWLIEEQGPAGIVAMLKEMQRVARQKIIVTVRVRDHKWAVSRHLVESALDGWRVHEDAEGYVQEYRVMELRPE
jgi:ubiquinone/menaquinone biosynthesis C-methylase UbiE